MANKVDKQIDELKIMAREELISEWEKYYGHPPPKHIGRNLLIRSIAYKYQEEVYGGLSAEARKQLEKLIREYKSTPDNSVRKILKIKPGTRLLRSWKGKLQEVIATENGFFFNGKEYGSLSEVARTITGTRWSGIAFFGLGKEAKAKIEVAS